MGPERLVDAIKARDVDALIEIAELNSNQANCVVNALSDPEMLHRLETVELDDRPRIELNDHGVYKATEALSTGQKCNTILPLLLLDSDTPLLVDQPEDNLDNRFVFETIVNSVQCVKPLRQLIFVTHNPNIPVLGDAERVMVMESDGRLAGCRRSGSVDQCKREIITILEGGADAFSQRQNRYASL